MQSSNKRRNIQKSARPKKPDKIDVLLQGGKHLLCEIRDWQILRICENTFAVRLFICCRQ